MWSIHYVPKIRLYAYIWYFAYCFGRYSHFHPVKQYQKYIAMDSLILKAIGLCTYTDENKYVIERYFARSFLLLLELILFPSKHKVQHVQLCGLLVLSNKETSKLFESNTKISE